jgi:hypothetical protein
MIVVTLTLVQLEAVLLSDLATTSVTDSQLLLDTNQILLKLLES